MGGKGGGGAVKSEPTTVEGQDYWDRYPDVAQSGLNPYYHYETYGKNEGRTYGVSSGGEEGFSFEMPSFEMPAMPDYAAIQAEAQAKAQRQLLEQQVDSLYSSKFAAANSAVDKVDTQLSEEMGYAKVAGADYSYTPEQRKERINNVFASLWSAENESKLSGLESEVGSAGNRWTLDIVRGAKADEDGALADKEAEKAGAAVDPSKVLSKLLGSGLEEEEDKLGGVLGKLGGA